MKSISMIVAGVAVLGLQAAEPTVDQVSVTQSGVSRVVEVSYRLSGAPAVVTAELSVGGKRVTGAALASLEGEVNRRLDAGSSLRRFLWKPEVPVDPAALTVSVTAWSVTNPPTYMVCQCAMTNTADTIKYYAAADQLPYAEGLTNVAYKTTRIVFRKIPASGIVWRMGDKDSTSGPTARHQVTLTNNYYMAVYPTTVQQYRFLTLVKSPVDAGGWTADVQMPKTASQASLRGALTDDWRGWPQKGHAVKAGSDIDKFRGMLGVAVDLPTEAQWEFACRAGQGTAYYDGTGVSDENLTPLAWFLNHGGQVDHEVGLLKPNAWGLYDCLGNVPEWALDWEDLNSVRPDATDPQGPTNDDQTLTKRSIRGGGSWYGSGSCTCYSVLDQLNTAYAFRLAAPCCAP